MTADLVAAVLFAAPLLIMFGFLLAGRYPGENALHGHHRLATAPTDRARRAPSTTPAPAATTSAQADGR